MRSHRRKGTVSLTCGKQTSPMPDARSRGRDRISPLVRRLGTEYPQRRAGDEMALEVKGVVDGGVHAEKTLRGASRLELLHFALSPSHSLMRVFGSIVLPQPLLMRAGQSQTPEGAGVGAQLVGDQQLGSEALLLEQLAHQSQGRPSVPPTLNQHVEHLAFVVNGTPQIHPLAVDPHHHFVEVPATAWPRTAPA